MNTEEDEFNRIEREASMRQAAVKTTVTKKEWAGLTDEEKSDIWCVVTNRTFVTEDTHVYADAIEELLRKKNT